jgi:hypothetical protein
MAKKIIIVILLGFGIFLVACQKDNQQDSEILVQGLSDVESRVGDTKTISLSLSNVQGKKDSIKFAMNNLPDGVCCKFTPGEDVKNLSVNLSLIVTTQVKLGQYAIKLDIASATQKKSIPFVLNIADTVSMIMTVYDATAYEPNTPYGKFADNATIKLYTEASKFFSDLPYYKVNTDNHGMANFYHLPRGNYFFIVEKGGLSNIVGKEVICGKLKGYATCGIFQNNTEIRNGSQPLAQIGQLMYRDQNNDGEITDADRVSYDILWINNSKTVVQKLIWIGK